MTIYGDCVQKKPDVCGAEFVMFANFQLNCRTAWHECISIGIDIHDIRCSLISILFWPALRCTFSKILPNRVRMFCAIVTLRVIDN